MRWPSEGEEQPREHGDVAVLEMPPLEEQLLPLAPASSGEKMLERADEDEDEAELLLLLLRDRLPTWAAPPPEGRCSQ